MTEDSSQKLRDLLFFKGFEEVASGIAKRQGISMERARAILAAGTRRAGTAARKKNPALNRVQGGKHNPIKKAVILGRTYDQPIPMPMLPNGMPDWNAPDINSYVSLLLDGSPKLKGRVVVLHRLANGMYTIAVDGEHAKDPEDRDKDKNKLRKERDGEMSDQDNYDTSVGENVILRSLSSFNRKIMKSFPYGKAVRPDYVGNRYSYFMLKGGKAIACPRGFGPLHPRAKVIEFADPVSSLFQKSIIPGIYEEHDRHIDNHGLYMDEKNFIDETIDLALRNKSLYR
jgi:hypothetical protein